MRKILPFACIGLALLLSSCTHSFLHSSAAEKTSAQEEAILADSAQKSLESQTYDKAIAGYTSLVNKAPHVTRYQLGLADAYRLNGNSAAALPLYDKVIATRTAAKHPSSEVIQAIEGKGLAYMQQGKFADAIRAFNEVLNEDASRWRTLNAIAVALALTNRSKEALAYYNVALNLSPNQPAILNNRGLSLALSGNLKEGLVDLQNALAFSTPDNKQRARIALNLALVYGITGNMQAAERAATPYLSKPALYNNLGYYALLAKNKDLAKAYLTKALSAGASPKALDTLNTLQ